MSRYIIALYHQTYGKLYYYYYYKVIRCRQSHPMLAKAKTPPLRAEQFEYLNYTQNYIILYNIISRDDGVLHAVLSATQTNVGVHGLPFAALLFASLELEFLAATRAWLRLLFIRGLNIDSRSSRTASACLARRRIIFLYFFLTGIAYTNTITNRTHTKVTNQLLVRGS